MSKADNEIRIIDLLNKIANGEEVPSNIKVEDKEYCLDGSTYYTVGEDDEDLFCLESYTNTLDFLKLEVEILEDNTEEIEELYIEKIYNTATPILIKESLELCQNKINELVKAVKEIRKDLNK